MRKMRFYIGIDIGTSAVKAILVDETGQHRGSSSSALSVMRPCEGYSEQDPHDWFTATDAVLSDLASRFPDQMADVAALGLSGQMHGLVALSSDGQVLRPALLWNDVRAAAEAEALDRHHPHFRAVGGNIVMAGFTAPKAVWMARHEPELFQQTATILLPKDYVRFCLSGARISDMSDASGTLWLDIENRRWSEELLDICGLSLAQMPDLAEGSEACCTLSPELAERWGMRADIVIAGGAGDNAASAIGLGLSQPDDSFISLGTSGVVFSVTDSYKAAPEKAVHAFCHALPESWHQMGVILAATDCISWLSEVTSTSLDDLLEQMSRTDLSDTWPLFHPYLSGERTPHNHPDARGGFYGLTRRHHAGDMMRAVLQGVAYAITDSAEALQGNADTSSKKTMIATGGGAKNQYWLKSIASLTGCQIEVPKQADHGAALGAARLGMLADGATLSDICIRPDIAELVVPDAEFGQKLNEARHISSQIYHLIRDKL